MLADFGSASRVSGVIEGAAAIMRAEDDIRRATTPAYRAPEMWDLYSKEAVDYRVDLWVRRRGTNDRPFCQHFQAVRALNTRQRSNGNGNVWVDQGQVQTGLDQHGVGVISCGALDLLGWCVRICCRATPSCFHRLS